MNKINSMRAKLLYEMFNLGDDSSQVKITFAEMVRKVLTIPSYSEAECCTKSERNFPVIDLSEERLDDLLNMENIIKSKFDIIPKCTRCKKKLAFKRTIGNHLLIEVSHLIKHNIPFLKKQFNTILVLLTTLLVKNY